MTSPGGAQYLPPVVTRLLGDASNLLAALAEARAAQEAFAKSSVDMADKVKSSTRGAGRDVDDFTGLLVHKMKAGESAAMVLKRRLSEVGDEVAHLRRRLATDSANQGLFADFHRASDELKRLRNLARDIAPDLLNAGERGGQGFLRGFISGFSGIGELMMPLLIGAVVIALPVVGALIASGIAVALGLGFAAIGTVLAALLIPKVQKSFVTIGRTGKRALTDAVSGGFDDGLKKALSIFNRRIPSFGKQLRGIFDNLGPMLPKLADALSSGIGDLLTGIGTAIAQITSNGSLQTFIDTIPMVMQSIGEFFVTITKDGPALSRFIADAAHAVVAFIDGLAEVVLWLTKAYNWGARLNESFKFMGTPGEAIKGWSIALKAAGTWFADLWRKIVDGVKGVGRWFAGLGASIWNWLKRAGSAVANFVVGVIDWFSKLPGRILRFIESIPGRVIAFVSRMAHGVAYWIGYMVGTWLRIMSELPGKILGLIVFIWAWTTQKTQEALTWLVEHIKALPGQIGNFFAQLWTTVTTWVAKTWTSAVLWFTRTKQSIIERIGTAITAAIEFFKGLPGRTSTELVKFKDRVIAFFKGAKDWLVEAGKDIVRGVVHGIEDAWDWAVGKVKSFGKDLVKGFKDAIGSHSPAKAFAVEGMNSALGYIQGWRNSIKRVQDAVSGRRTLDVVMRYPTGGNPRTPPPVPPGGSGGPDMVQANVYLDGKRFATAFTPASQKRGQRNGITGTGLPSARIM